MTRKKGKEKKEKGCFVRVISKNMIGIRSIQHLSLSDPSMLFLYHLVDGIIQPSALNDKFTIKISKSLYRGMICNKYKM